MTFEVCANKRRRRKLLFARILCLVSIFGILWFVSLEPMAEYFLREPEDCWILMLFLGVFALLGLFSFYSARRPRISVDGPVVVLYPLFRPARRLTWSEITGRKAVPDLSFLQGGTPVSTAADGLPGPLIARKASGNRETDCSWPGTPCRYTYYQGRERLIVISSREMEHAEEFDRLVCDHLQGKVPETAWERAAPEPEPAKKRHPAVWAGVIAAVCVLGTGIAASAGKQQTASPVLTGSCTCRGITFSIDPAWSDLRGTEGAFTDDTAGIIYQLGGVSALSPYDAEGFYTGLLRSYEEGRGSLTAGPLERGTAPDGTERYLASVQVARSRSDFRYITLVIFPRQDTVAIFEAQTSERQADQNGDSIRKTVESMAQSAVCTGDGKGTQGSGLDAEYFADTAWIASNDGSRWEFGEDGTFHWYRDGNVKDDNYYAGTCTFYTGEEAMDYLTGPLAEYGITAEELTGLFSASEEYSLGNLVCLAAVNQTFILEGREQLSAPRETYYFGFLLEDGTHLSLLNLQTASRYEFAKEL